MNSLQRAWKHVTEQPFIAATGFAALVHSTWSLGTLFSGAQPASPVQVAEAGAWVAFALQTLAWHVPALAIAFALDVGQIATSHDIRMAVQSGATPWKKYVVFVVFAVATYYLQWLYCAHHMPALPLGEGVSQVHMQAANTLRDLAVWIVPLFLPLSTLMYTFSHSRTVQAVEEAAPLVHVQAVQIHVDALPAPVSVAQPQAAPAKPHASATGNYTGEASAAVKEVEGAYVFTCPHCGRSKSYAVKESAVKGASAHVGRYCTKRPPTQQEAFEAARQPVVSTNGHHEEAER